MVASTLLALSEPTRLRIVETLVVQPRSVSELCQALGIDQPLVSKHLRVLRTAGLVGAQQVQRNRIYSLQPGPLRELSGWVERFRSTWEARYAGVDELLTELKNLEREENHGSDQG